MKVRPTSKGDIHETLAGDYRLTKIQASRPPAGA